MMSWENKVLGKIAEFTNGGAWNQSEYSDSGVPVVRVSDVQNETVDLGNCKYLPRAAFERYRKHELLTGDLIICTVGSHPTQPGSVVGRPAIVPKVANGALLNQNAVRIRPSSKEIDKRWLGYIGRSPFFRNYIISHARGSANQVRMAIGLLKQMPVSVPPFETQCKIATILSAYDDLVENNSRRIKILQEMAQAIYREWFVNFRFPGHEKIKMVDSPLGKIPEGWEVKSLFELAVVKYGKNLPRKNLVENGPYPVYGAAKTIGHYSKYTRERRTIICGCRGSVGEMQITEPKCFVTNNSFTFEPTHADNFFWLYQTLKHRGLQDVIGGAAQPQITLEGISSVESAVPALSLRTQYQQAVSPIYELAWRLGSKIENLRQTRDLLLPKLISGAIDVSILAVGIEAT
jgi:type I restriction enzyme, S subunit